MKDKSSQVTDGWAGKGTTQGFMMLSASKGHVNTHVAVDQGTEDVCMSEILISREE